MKKIGIYLCGEVSKKCTANGCLKAFNQKQDAFQAEDGSAYELVSFNHCNGCDEEPMESLQMKIEKLQKAEVDTVHLSTCIRGRCNHYEEFADELSEHFNVIGYTHGSAQGKRNNNINKSKVISSEA